MKRVKSSRFPRHIFPPIVSNSGNENYISCSIVQCGKMSIQPQAAFGRQELWGGKAEATRPGRGYGATTGALWRGRGHRGEDGGNGVRTGLAPSLLYTIREVLFCWRVEIHWLWLTPVSDPFVHYSHLNARPTSSMEATIQASRTRTLVWMALQPAP
jgi:hypothetical protein